MEEGLVDTNVFIHALTHDALAEECLAFLESVYRGRIRARLDPVVLHELSYAFPHYRREMTRAGVAEYLLAVLGWEGIVAEKGLLVESVERWRDTPGLAFVDAYLAALAARDRCPAFTKNVAEMRGLGVGVPDPLPAG